MLTRRAKISVKNNNEEAAHVCWQGENKYETNKREKTHRAENICARLQMMKNRT